MIEIRIWQAPPEGAKRRKLLAVATTDSMSNIPRVLASVLSDADLADNIEKISAELKP